MIKLENTQLFRRAARFIGGEQTPPWRVIYWVYATALVAVVAVGFWSQMRLQLAFSQARAGATAFQHVLSAPLDDVFIHFDFARSAARGHPWEWAPGNGYSSGGTSLSYPMLLALGYDLGFTGSSLMLWAGVVACVSVVVLLHHGARLHDKLPWYSAFCLPPLMLSVGGLSWSLMSGMEVAFFLAVWSLALWRWLLLCQAANAESPESASAIRDGVAAPPKGRGRGNPAASARSHSTDFPVPSGKFANRELSSVILRQAAWLGLANAALVATRPEAAILVAIFSISSAFAIWRKIGWQEALRALCVSAVPGATVIMAQMVANRVFTGEWSAAGAVAKLELHHPYLTAQQVFDAWWFHVRYQVARVTYHHFAQDVKLGPISLVHAGWLIWALALVPWFSKKTRSAAALLWSSAILWTLLVALNGQVRWQNERYTMPAVAFMLLCCSLGVGLVLTHVVQGRGMRRLAWGAPLVTALVLFAMAQLPQYRDQLWFFGRASRNIYEQHVTTAKLIRQEAQGKPVRVLVGDAGAIPYVSKEPALDIIGLGGYHQFPFARATRYGVAAALELIARLPHADRPDLLAVYPSWWGDLVTWFGEPEFGVTARGNVICGGLTKMVYKPDWTPLNGSNDPFSLSDGEAVVDDVDVADVMSEKSHALQVENATGYVAMKMLPDPAEQKRDLWDAGRILPTGSALSFDLKPAPGEGTLVIRLAPPHPIELRVTSAGTTDTVKVAPKDAWQEVRLPWPKHPGGESKRLRLEVTKGEAIVYQVWSVSEPSSSR